MQIAQIVPKVLTKKEDVFDYAIPPEILPQIRQGVLVEIPFHGRKLEGIIIKLKSKSQILNLKSIIKVVDPLPVVDDVHIKLAKWMSNYYLAPLGKTLFENIVPPAKRILKKEASIPDISKSTSYPTFDALASKSRKKYLVVADFLNRLKFYHKAINKTLAKKNSVIILVPDISLIHFFFQKNFKKDIHILHSQMTKTERWLAWQKIRQGKNQIVIGSNSALFAPVSDLGLIIIDQEENETYKNDRSPRFHAVKTAETLSKLTAVNLVLGSNTPSIESYFKALNGSYVLKKAARTLEKEIIIVQNEGRKQALSPTLQEKIEETLQSKKKIILVLNRKGEGNKFFCPDCHFVTKCPECELPLILNKEKLECFRCKITFDVPEKCPKCQNVNLRSFGLGTINLEKFVKDFWPKAKIIRIDETVKQKIIGRFWDIAIVTSYALKFNFPPIGLVAIIDADQALNFPNFRQFEKSFQSYYKFLSIGEKGVIQTGLKDSFFISSLAKLDYEKFFLEELLIRKKSNFPPYIKLIRLLYKNKDEEKCRDESRKLLKILLNFLKESKNPRILIQGPTPATFKKRRDVFRFQIILKVFPEKKQETYQNLIHILKNLPKGWTADVDPVELL